MNQLDFKNYNWNKLIKKKMLKQFLKLTYSKLSKFELPLHPEECDGVDDDQSMCHLH